MHPTLLEYVLVEVFIHQPVHNYNCYIFVGQCNMIRQSKYQEGTQTIQITG